MIIDITSSNINFNGFRFLKRAMVNYQSDLPLHNKYIIVKDGKAYSTDGARVHSFMIQNSKAQIKNGLYLPTISRCNLFQIVKSEYQTSVVLKIIKFFEELFACDGYDDVPGFMPIYKDNYYTAIYVLNRNGFMVNPRYINDLQGDFKIMTHHDLAKPVLFIGDKRRAGIITTRHDEDRTPLPDCR